jgi:hypothetical protein
MPADINEIMTASLGGINVGLAAAAGVINPLAAQIDAGISLGLSPLQVDLAAQFDAAVSLSITPPSLQLEAALAALIDLEASIRAALLMPSITVGADVSAAISAKIGMIQALIEGMIAIKIPALGIAAQMAAAMSAGTAVLLSFNGIADPQADLETIGGAIAAKFSAPIGDNSGPILPTDPVAGVIIPTAP